MRSLSGFFQFSSKSPGDADRRHGGHAFDEFGQGDLAVEVAQVGAAGDEDVRFSPVAPFQLIISISALFQEGEKSSSVSAFWSVRRSSSVMCRSTPISSIMRSVSRCTSTGSAAYFDDPVNPV
jgi:hypothetical protein